LYKTILLVQFLDTLECVTIPGTYNKMLSSRRETAMQGAS